jgi:hypothetical protein
MKGVKINKSCSICGSYNRMCLHDGIPYCGKHIAQIRKHGEISKRTRFDSNEIILYDNYAEIILYDAYGEEINRTMIDLDDVEICKKYKWQAHKSGGNKFYAVARIKGSNKLIRLHRLILNFSDTSRDIDHINGNGLDNRKNNLHIATRQENMMNQRIIPSNNTSGYIGVTWNKRANKWSAQIKINGKHISLGDYINIEDAIKARKDGELKYFGKNKFINFEEDNNANKN